MKKLLVALTVAVFLVGLALPAMAIPDPAVGDGYHEVYTWDGTAWVPLPVLERYCEMFSKISNIEQWNFESDPAATVCSGPYLPPEPEDPIQKHIYNYAHVFPWIKIHFNQTRLIWDVFKPGNYMAKAFIIGLQANTPVLIHFGAGTFKTPDAFVDGQDGKITFRDETKEGEDAAFGDKKRLYSLLDKPADVSGTPPDVIDVMWWWVQGDVDDWDDPHYMTDAVPAKTNVVDSPKGPFPAGWVKAPNLNSDYTIVKDSDELHVAKFIVFYEDIEVEPCDSEGKYFDKFVISITPDP